MDSFEPNLDQYEQSSYMYCTHWLKELETTFQLARYDIQAEDPSPSVMALHRQKYPGIYPSNCRKENVKLQADADHQVM